MVNTLYVGGYGRSGSTVLDSMLGSHPKLFGGGELSHIFTEVSEGRCSCGREYTECLFWKEVLGVLRKRLPDLNLMAMRSATRRMESFGVLPPGNGRKTQILYAKVWTAMLDALRAVSGKDVIVDSSKTARMCSHRISSLVKLCGAELNVIHLVRDPRAVTWSLLKGSNRKLEDGKKGRVFGGVYRAIFGWTLANLSVHRVKSEIPVLKVRRVRYEDLVRDPLEELKMLEAWSEVDMSPIRDIAKGSWSVEPGHGVGGNRLRRKGPFLIREDVEWKRALPAKARIIASIYSWPLARIYGYDVFKKP